MTDTGIKPDLPAGSLQTHREAALAELRWILVAGLGLHLVVFRVCLDRTVAIPRSAAAELVFHASDWLWWSWWLVLPAAVLTYVQLERRFLSRLSLWVLHETTRLATVLWLGMILPLWYPWHRTCNCLEYLSETNLTVATLPALAVSLFVVSLIRNARGRSHDLPPRP
ncbi:MAG: hypothetical protein HY814_04775 [Candidatus Riflebacteria bacterium]|nr:hypothetical protein [Candidatus Riflebacteria bacterium]